MLILSKQIVDGLIDHAKNGLPEEVCGYLAGNDRTVTQQFRLTNIDHSPEHFSFDPAEQFQVVREARKLGLEILTNYHSHPETPLILKLHKIGPVEPMVYVEERRCSLPFDGSVRCISLDSDKGLGNHPIEFRLKSDRIKLSGEEIYEKLFDWSFEARIPGGGFIWSDSDYAFDAPETGYRETIRLEYKADMPKGQWQRMVYGSFFVKFADGSHGRIRIGIDGLSKRSPLMLASWLNLKPGSNNLATNQTDGSGFDREANKKQWK